MALRFRTRLSLTISLLVVLTAATMTLAIAGMLAYDVMYQDLAQDQQPPQKGLRYVVERVAVVALVGLAMVVFSLATAAILSRGLAKPIMALSEGARQFGQGNLNYRVIWHGRDEFEDLAHAFNIMAISLQEYTHELQQETTRRERLESEFRIAEDMQRALLPKTPPNIPGLGLAGWSQPSREVGGDFYDFIELGPGRLAAVLGDAAGKGLPAALLITQCSGVLRVLAHEEQHPAKLLSRANDELFDRIGETYRFVTICVFIFDLQKRTVTYASAGHPPAVLIKGETGLPQWLASEPSFPLGIRQHTQYAETEFDLSPGDTIVLYSDGLTDAQNLEREAYGEARIEALLAREAGATADAVLHALRGDCEIHRAGREPVDDTTLAAIRFDPETEPAT